METEYPAVCRVAFSQGPRLGIPSGHHPVVPSKLLDRTMLYTAIPANSKIGTEFFWMTLLTADSSTGNQDSGPYSNAARPVHFDIATAGARLFHQ
ncbi:hypothetical protein IE4771_PB00274 (plasmid) [Rhizobium etli bv. mimosae str. IE4771]|uniref:Uncharacterized protein n=1 Tax=Rhizobium etli bv. mimosae str. IE4771 TaxID=1432050 RepID=A0A060I808_RHIET|nr:hypothetical protein IE4771_PB00274 [Rhizobium sp. IE4771]